VFESLDCAKEYLRVDEGEHKRMTGYRFTGRDGYFDELLEALDGETGP
jgi:hypothetical protein